MVKQNITDLALKFVKYQTRVINTQNGGGRTQTLEKFNVYSRKLNKYTAELNDAGVNVNTLQQLVMRGGATRADVEGVLTSILTDHNDQIQAMVGEVNARNTRIEALNEMLTELVAKYKANEQTINGLRDRIGVLERQLRDEGDANVAGTEVLQQQIAGLTQQLTGVQADNVAIAALLQECNNDKDGLQARYEALQADLLTRHAELDAANARIVDFQRQLQESEAREVVNRQEIDRLRDELYVERARATDLQADIDAIHTRAQEIRGIIQAVPDGAVVQFNQLPPELEREIARIRGALP